MTHIDSSREKSIMIFFFFFFTRKGKRRIKWDLKLNICSSWGGLQKEKIWVRWMKRETERVLKLCALFAECSLCEDWWVRKKWKLQCSVYPKIKYWIGQASTMQSSLPFTVSQLWPENTTLWCAESLSGSLTSQGLKAFLSYARNKMDLQKLIMIQFSKSLSTPVTPFYP